MNNFIAAGAFVLGDVELGEGASVWFNAVVRADDRKIHIGKNSNIQDNATVHVETSLDVWIGDGVTVGHNAIVHGCEIGDNTLIGMGAIVMNRASVGRNCIIGAGSVVTEGMVIPDNSLVMGIPARVTRKLTDEEIKSNTVNATHYVEKAEKYKKLSYG